MPRTCAAAYKCCSPAGLSPWAESTKQIRGASPQTPDNSIAYSVSRLNSRHPAASGQGGGEAASTVLRESTPDYAKVRRIPPKALKMSAFGESPLLTAEFIESDDRDISARNFSLGQGADLRRTHVLLLEDTWTSAPLTRTLVRSPCGALEQTESSEGYQVANELTRFAIGDRDPLTFNADRSLDIYLQHTNPGPDRKIQLAAGPAGPTGDHHVPAHAAARGPRRHVEPPHVRKA